MAKRITLSNRKITMLGDAFNEFTNHCMAKGLATASLKYYRKNREYIQRFKIYLTKGRRSHQRGKHLENIEVVQL